MQMWSDGCGICGLWNCLWGWTGKVLCEVAAVVSWASLMNMWRISWLWFEALDKFHTHLPKMQISQEYYIHWEYRDWMLVLLVPLFRVGQTFLFFIFKDNFKIQISREQKIMNFVFHWTTYFFNAFLCAVEIKDKNCGGVYRGKVVAEMLLSRVLSLWRKHRASSSTYKTSIVSEWSDCSISERFQDKQWVVRKIQNYNSLYFLHRFSPSYFLFSLLHHLFFRIFPPFHLSFESQKRWMHTHFTSILSPS